MQIDVEYDPQQQLRVDADVLARLAIPSFFEIKESGGARKLSEKNRICFF
jgi:hypothetical protein